MGRHGANLDKVFAVADKAGCKLTPQIFDAHKGGADISFKAAQRRYNAHCKEAEARSLAAAQVNAPSHGRVQFPPASRRAGSAPAAGSCRPYLPAARDRFLLESCWGTRSAACAGERVHYYRPPHQFFLRSDTLWLSRRILLHAQLFKKSAIVCLQ